MFYVGADNVTRCITYYDFVILDKLMWFTLKSEIQ